MVWRNLGILLLLMIAFFVILTFYRGIAPETESTPAAATIPAETDSAAPASPADEPVMDEESLEEKEEGWEGEARAAVVGCLA